MCTRLSCLAGAFLRAYASEHSCRINFDDQSDQPINSAHKFEVLPGAYEPTSYKDYGSLCPNHFHGNYHAHSRATRIRFKRELSMRPDCEGVGSGDFQPPNRLNQSQVCRGVDKHRWLFLEKATCMLPAMAKSEGIALAVAKYSSVSDQPASSLL
jgi:hypothetical protein